ncbi:MAG: hypothetical protein LAO78_24200 [Acidobacteriia bacterium]|nr:hypothetical protein [Terriglobia bacterium]
MTFPKLFKISLLVLTVAVIGLALLPANANAQNKITCITGSSGCALCFDSCQDGVVCYGTACPDGSGGGGCIPCTSATNKQPLDLQKGTTHSKQSDKVLLAQLLSKDTEISQALKSLK